MHSLVADPLLMAKKRKPAAVKPLYVGQWIRATNHRPRDVVKGTGINEGYLSEIISGGKKNPSAAKLMQIAEFLKVPLGNLYKPPPPQSFLDQVVEYDPAVIVRLTQKRSTSG